jgi:hypothetical protein
LGHASNSMLADPTCGGRYGERSCSTCLGKELLDRVCVKLGLGFGHLNAVENKFTVVKNTALELWSGLRQVPVHGCAKQGSILVKCLRP